MHKGTLSKILGGSKLRSETITGVFERLPKVGRQFSIFAEPIHPKADIRRATTSRVVDVENVDGRTIFTTASGSIYQLDLEVF